jgi:hypothetical protein
VSRRTSFRRQQTQQQDLPLSMRSFGDPFGDVLLTPTFTSQEIAMLIEVSCACRFRNAWRLLAAAGRAVQTLGPHTPHWDTASVSTVAAMSLCAGSDPWYGWKGTLMPDYPIIA